MKSTKTMLLATLAVGSLLAFSPALRADDTNTPPAKPPVGVPPGGPRGGAIRGGPSLDQLATALNLTDDQKAKVKPILEARDSKMKDLRADTSLSPEDRRAKMQSIRQETQDKMKAVLTPEQLDKYQKMGQRQRRPAPGGENTPPPANPKQN
jgi:Spy/CpxP family protein refolding chaperone